MREPHRRDAMLTLQLFLKTESPITEFAGAWVDTERKGRLMLREKAAEGARAGRWRFGVFWSWYDPVWTVGIVSVPPLGAYALHIGPLRVVVLVPVHREIDEPCGALPAAAATG
jgi:hypothetical protein